MPENEDDFWEPDIAGANGEQRIPNGGHNFDGVLRILVVDDMRLRDELNGFEWEDIDEFLDVDYADSWADAVSAVRLFTFHVVLADYRMLSYIGEAETKLRILQCRRLGFRGYVVATFDTEGTDDLPSSLMPGVDAVIDIDPELESRLVKYLIDARMIYEEHEY